MSSLKHRRGGTPLKAPTLTFRRHQSVAQSWPELALHLVALHLVGGVVEKDVLCTFRIADHEKMAQARARVGVGLAVGPRAKRGDGILSEFQDELKGGKISLMRHRCCRAKPLPTVYDFHRRFGHDRSRKTATVHVARQPARFKTRSQLTW